MNPNEFLTNLDMGILDTIANTISDIHIEAPRSLVEADPEDSLLVLEAKGKVRLSAQTRSLEYRRLATIEKKKKPRKKYTRKPGHVHPKKKLATQRRLKAKRWANNPRGCLLHSWGSWELPEEQWNTYLAPLWEQYEPSALSVRRIIFDNTKGKRSNPYTIWDIVVVHKTKGPVWTGPDEYLYWLSSPVSEATNSYVPEASSS